MLKKLVKAAPNQRDLLVKGALMLVTTYYEALIAKILGQYYRKTPGAISGECKTVTIDELMRLSSINEAIEIVVEKEVNSFLRESMIKQIKTLKEKHKLKLNITDQSLDEIIEIDQRRNLHVHNMGKANKFYFDNVCPKLLEKYKAKLGDELPLNTQY